MIRRLETPGNGNVVIIANNPPARCERPLKDLTVLGS